MHPDNPLRIVHAWQEAVNDRNLDRLLELSAPDVHLIGPKGSARGHQALRQWFERAWLHMNTIRSFVRGTHVVVVQKGLWRSLETGKMLGEATLASWFQIDGGQVTLCARYDDLDTALHHAGLNEGDEVGLF